MIGCPHKHDKENIFGLLQMNKMLKYSGKKKIYSAIILIYSYAYNQESKWQLQTTEQHFARQLLQQQQYLSYKWRAVWCCNNRQRQLIIESIIAKSRKYE